MRRVFVLLAASGFGFEYPSLSQSERELDFSSRSSDSSTSGPALYSLDMAGVAIPWIQVRTANESRTLSIHLLTHSLLHAYILCIHCRLHTRPR